jgi:hypothetical protein
MMAFSCIMLFLLWQSVDAICKGSATDSKELVMVQHHAGKVEWNAAIENKGGVAPRLVALQLQDHVVEGYVKHAAMNCGVVTGASAKARDPSTGQTAQTCASICDQQPGCSAFMVGQNQRLGECYLKSDIVFSKCNTTEEWAANWDMYTKDCPTGYFEYPVDITTAGGVKECGKGNTEECTVDDCARYCSAAQTCIAFEFSPNPGNSYNACYKFATVTTGESRSSSSGWTSCVKVPATNSECTWNYKWAQCNYKDYCEYQYVLGDLSFDQSCRLK